MSDGIRATVSARSGWGSVVVGGTAAALLATYPDLGEWIGRAVATVAGWVWRLPYVAPVVCVAAGLGVAAVGALRLWRVWRG